MSHRLPPIEEVLSTAKFVVLPAAAVALVMLFIAVMVVVSLARFARSDWRRWFGVSFPLALFAAIAAVNHFRDQPIPWQPDGKWWHEVIWLFGVALAIDLLSPVVTRLNLSSWLIGLAGGLAACVVISPNLRAEMVWIIPVAGLAIALNGLITYNCIDRSTTNASSVGLAAWTGAVSLVLLHAKSLGFADLALGTSIALSVSVAFAWLTRTPMRTFSIVMPLTAFLFMNRQLVDSDMPKWLLIVTGTIPTLFLLNRLSPSNPRREWLTALVMVIASIAVVMASATFAPMVFDEEKW